MAVLRRGLLLAEVFTRYEVFTEFYGVCVVCVCVGLGQSECLRCVWVRMWCVWCVCPVLGGSEVCVGTYVVCMVCWGGP